MKTMTFSKKLYGKKSLIAASVFVTGLIFLSASCKDDPPKPNPENNSPVISSISPASGQPGDTISIDGKNFNDGASNTKVVFNSTPATIISGTVATIEVVVPAMDAGAVDVVAIVDGGSSAAKSFSVLKPIEIDDFTPKTGKYGDEITITGQNFTENIEVYINGKQQTDITLVNSEKITIRLEKQTGSGKVTLKNTVNNREKTYADELAYEFGYTVQEYSKYGGVDIQVLDDGSCYVTYSSGLLKLDPSGEITDTIIAPNSGTVAARGLFMAKDGTLFITDRAGKILKLEKGAKTINTLISNDINLPFFTLRVTGDNLGYLYVTTLTNYSIVKVDIATKSTKIICNTTDDKTIGITLVGDSLYVTTANGLFKVHKDGGKPEYILTEEDGYSFASSDIGYHPSGNLFIANATTVDQYGFYRVTSDYNVIDKLDQRCHGLSFSKEGNAYVCSSGSSYKIIIE